MSDPILGKCAICGKPAVEKFKPFCSSRCSMVDLGQWLGEGYRVPAEDPPEDGLVTGLPDRED